MDQFEPDGPYYENYEAPYFYDVRHRGYDGQLRYGPHRGYPQEQRQLQPVASVYGNRRYPNDRRIKSRK